MKKLFYNSITLIILLSIIYLSLNNLDSVQLHVRNIDKFQHGLAYAVLAFFFCMSIRTWGVKKFQLIITVIFCGVVGGGLEILQSRYGRMMELGDFLADLSGASLACLIIFLKDHRAA